MIKWQRQSSYFKQKSQYLASNERLSTRARYKNPTNPSYQDPQISREVLNRSEETSHYPSEKLEVRSKIQKNLMRYSDESPLKTKAKLLPYREYEAYNFGHVLPNEPNQRKKKGRSYFHRKNEELTQEQNTQLSRESIKETKMQPANEAEPQLDIGPEELHYQLVKTFQTLKTNKF